MLQVWIGSEKTKTDASEKSGGTERGILKNEAQRKE